MAFQISSPKAKVVLLALVSSAAAFPSDIDVSWSLNTESAGSVSRPPSPDKPANGFSQFNQSSIIEAIGSSSSGNVSYLNPNKNESNAVYDLPFEYAGIGLSNGSEDLQCKGESFGFNLSRTSCQDALTRLPNGLSSMAWGQRGHGAFEMKLPYRINSADGYCAIDVVHAESAVSDIADFNDINAAATKIIEGCVKNGGPNTGGLIRSIGQNRNLVVVVRLYVPRVTCSEPISFGAGECASVLEALPVSTERLVFGPADDVMTHVTLPRTFRAGRQALPMGMGLPSDFLENIWYERLTNVQLRIAVLSKFSPSSNQSLFNGLIYGKQPKA